MGLLVRPVLVVPMATSGPMRDSELLPVALAALFLGSALLAAAVLLAGRPMIALALLSAVAGVPLALIGLVAGLTMPWPLVMGGYNATLAVAGALAWREERPSG